VRWKTSSEDHFTKCPGMSKRACTTKSCGVTAIGPTTRPTSGGAGFSSRMGRSCRLPTISGLIDYQGPTTRERSLAPKPRFLIILETGRRSRAESLNERAYRRKSNDTSQDVDPVGRRSGFRSILRDPPGLPIHGESLAEPAEAQQCDEGTERDRPYSPIGRRFALSQQSCCSISE
jgi:hypothetical protein